MYDDDEDEDKTAQEDSANSVRRAPDANTNTDPVFPDQDLNAPGVQTAQTREVAENTPAGRNLGPRVAATDPGDVLTYSLRWCGCSVVRHQPGDRSADYQGGAGLRERGHS